jgi:hypothetical protein
MEKKTIDERLKGHPHLKSRIEAILDITEGKDQDRDTADEVEERTINEVRKLGQEVIEDWASKKSSEAINNHKEKHPKAKTHKKKRLTGTQPSGELK